MIMVRRCTPEEASILAAAEPPGADVAIRQFERQERGESAFLVAWQSDLPLGSGELLFGDVDELRNLHVDAAARRRGVGTALIAAAERETRRRGARVLRVGVGLGNPDARRLYERLGYRGTGATTTTTYRYVDAAGEHEATETDEWLEKSVEA